MSEKEMLSLPKSKPKAKTIGSNTKREITTIIVRFFSDISYTYFAKNSLISKIASLILGPALEVMSASIL